MWLSLSKAILEAYTLAKPHLKDELPNTMNVKLLVSFKLGDLRELELVSEHVSEATGSGVPGDGI